MKLILPEWAKKEQVLDFWARWGDGEQVPHTAFPHGKSYEDWLKDVILQRTYIPEPYVTGTLYFLTDEAQTKLYGAVAIRHKLNEALLNSGGHIGYGIAPEERGKGYGKEQLRLALPVAKAHGIRRVLITCADWNTASAKTMEACGGRFDDIRTDEEGTPMRRYWFTVDQPTLETERLRLRQWRVEDAEDMFAYAKSDKVGPMAGWRPHQSVEDSVKTLEGWQDSGEVWAIEEKASCRVIGSIGLHPDHARSNPQTKMVGYVLNEDYWGRGYMPEAVDRLLQHAFEALCMDMVTLNHYADNTQSRRVAEKCGFTCEGVFRRSSAAVDGSVWDDVQWSILREEYFHEQME